MACRFEGFVGDSPALQASGPRHPLQGRHALNTRESGTGEGSVRAEARARLKARGVLVATPGYLLALALVFGLSLLGPYELDRPLWGWALLATLVAQGALWVVARTGWAERIASDPHFVRIPVLVAAGLFALFIYVTPEARFLLLMGWFVTLLFMAGLEGFRVVVVLSSVMTGLYLAALFLRVHQGMELPLGLEAVRATVFLAINVYAGLVFERIRRDREERKRLRSELARQAITDPLTGLPNRRYMEEFLEAEIARIDRYGGQVSLAMIDVDDFKNYNDTLGHVAGDEVLRNLAGVFGEQLRVSDIAARFGGEEFSVIMVNADRSEAEEAAERLRGLVEAHTFPREDIQPNGDLTVSVGVATYPRDATDYRALVEAADEALYRAKGEGKNRVRAA